MITIQLVPENEVMHIWPKIEKWVENALGNDKSYTINDIRQACDSGILALRIICIDKEIKGFLTYNIYEAPQCKCCYAPWLGGIDLAEWVPEAFEQFKTFLREQGVKQYSFAGRDAWKRFIKADYEGRFYLISF